MPVPPQRLSPSYCNFFPVATAGKRCLTFADSPGVEIMRTAASLMALAVAAAVAAPAMAQQHTLELVKQRGQLMCGVNGQAPGFSAMNDAKQWAGLDVDLCRAVASAVLGDSAKVTSVPVNAQER